MNQQQTITKPCKNGHFSARRKNRNCIQCEKERYRANETFREKRKKQTQKYRLDPTNSDHIENYMKEYRVQNREKLNQQANRRYAEGYGLKRRLERKGLSAALIEQVLNHPGMCDICGGLPDGRWKTLYIDHCHETGSYRGMLCGKCNKGLGLFRDNDRLLNNAIHYLNKFRKTIPGEALHDAA